MPLSRASLTQLEIDSRLSTRPLREKKRGWALRDLSQMYLVD